MATDKIDLNIANGNESHANGNESHSNGMMESNTKFSSTSSLGSNRSRFKYRGKMVSMKAMNQLPPVEENNSHQIPARNFSPLNKNRRPMWISIAAVFVYLFIGTLTYTLWIPDWNTADSIYFSMSTFTTVGFGDIVPMTDGQKAFTIFYILGATFLIGGIFYGFLFDHLYNAFEDISKDSKTLTCEYFIQRLDNGGADGMYIDQEESFWPEFCSNFRKVVPLLVALIVPPLIMGYYEDWDVLDTIYFTIVSATTVGYGNVAPTGIWTRLITVFYLPFCIGVMAKSFARLTSVYLKHKAKAAEQEFFNRKLSENDFELMDIEGDGAVGYDEFLVFMLVAMGKVSPEDIQKMEELYQRLDADSETHLKIEDLFNMAYGETKEV